MSILLLSLSSCKQNPLDKDNKPAGGEATNKPIVVYDYNPLTGLDKAENYPVGQRPVAVMINNLREALPQSGITGADLVYEMVTEGGITRMMAVFTDYKSMPVVGPVRSARDQFVQLMMPLNAIYVHIGSSIYADNMLNYYNYQDIDGLSLGTTAFFFDEERYRQPRASEHCWYTNAELLSNGVAKVMEKSEAFSDMGGFEPVFSFVMKDEAKNVPSDGDALNVSFNFSNYSDAVLTYDSASAMYLKSEYGAPQMDNNTNTQMGFTNFFLLSTKVELHPDGYCTKFDFTQGEGYYFYKGRFEKIKWQKGMPTDSLKLFDKDGNELKVNAGNSYIAFIDANQLSTLSITGTMGEIVDPNSVSEASQPESASQG